jgi:hypothetical protein
MGQINVNPSSAGSDRTGAATITLVTVVLVLAVLVFVGWWLVTTGPLSSNRSTDITVNVNVPKVEQPITSEPPPAAKP